MEIACPWPAGCLSHPIQPPHSCQTELSKKQILSGLPLLSESPPGLTIWTGFSQKVFLRDVSSPHRGAGRELQHHCSLAIRTCLLDAPPRPSANLQTVQPHSSPASAPLALPPATLKAGWGNPTLLLSGPDLMWPLSESLHSTPHLPPLGRAPVVLDHHLCGSSRCP